MVAELLHQMDYSLQANRKTLEGSSHPDRDAQFHHVSDKIREFQADRQPVISVDTRKKDTAYSHARFPGRASLRERDLPAQVVESPFNGVPHNLSRLPWC
jgi:hypothetical protein